MAYMKSANWTFLTPTSGSTVNIPIVESGTSSNVIINNTGILAAVTFAFPITGVQDGQVVKISAQSTITLVTMNVEAGGALWGGLASLLGGGSGIYQFCGQTKTWYKFN